MFNVGGPEIVVIILVALVVLGPEQLPKALRTFGNVMAEIRKVSGGFQAEMRSAMDGFSDDTPSARKDKPQSAKMAPATAQLPAQTSGANEVAEVAEVAGRNPGPDDLPAEGASEGEGPSAAAGPADDVVVQGPPAIDPIDRAAG